MPRALSTAMLTALSAGELWPAFFIEFNFSTGPVYVWTGMGTIAWNSQTWSGAGQLISVGNIEEGCTVEARGMQVKVSGFDASLLPDVVSDYQLGQPVTVYLGLFSAGSLIATPATSFAGRMDQANIDVDGSRGEIAIGLESRLMDLNTSCGRRYTPEDQQRDWPGDLGMIFVNQIQQITLYWGSAPTNSGTI